MESDDLDFNIYLTALAELGQNYATSTIKNVGLMWSLLFTGHQSIFEWCMEKFVV
jgi:hypothetical protein